MAVRLLKIVSDSSQPSLSLFCLIMSKESNTLRPLVEELSSPSTTPLVLQPPISPGIPQEIIDLIVDELADNKENELCRQTLYACARSCHSFRSRVIVHTFGRIAIIQRSSIDDMHSRFEGLLDILQRDPFIGSNVHELEICGSSVPFFVSFWLGENPTVPLVFQHLNFVERLVLRQKGERPISWTSIQRETVFSLLAILESPHLQSLKLERFKDFPVGLIKRCKRLEEICLTHIECPPGEHLLTPGHLIFFALFIQIKADVPCQSRK